VLELCALSGSFELSRLDALDGVVSIRGKALTPTSSAMADPLYRKGGQTKFRETPVTLIPYYAWCNREPSKMTVWIPQG
jgi:DUF1680 family protein